MSSSKLQSCLELCRFIQTLFNKRVARWKVYFIIRLAKGHCATFIRTDGVLRYATGKESVVVESHSYSTSHLSPKAYCFSKIVDTKPFLVCFEALLDFPKQCRISPSPNQVYALGHIYHRVILHRFLCPPPPIVISAQDFF
jgi:hypothetical protein